MGIKFITDSASDITVLEANQMGICVLPLRVSFDEEHFLDGVTINHRRFFEKLIETDVFPVTSQVGPYDYINEYDKIKADGDVGIVITISSALSGCYQSATIAREGFEDCIYVVDSLNATVGERALIELALRLRDEGKSAKEIVEILEEKKRSLKLIGRLETLEYLRKGGRISATVAVAGTVLSIRPVVALDSEGKIVMVGTARGSKKADNKLRELVAEAGGIDFDMPFVTAYSGLSDESVKKYIEDSESLYKGSIDSVPYHTIGAVIGAHVGPGAIAFAFWGKEK